MHPLLRRNRGLKRTPPNHCHAAVPIGTALACALALLCLAVSPSLAANGDCGQPVSSGSSPMANDCGYILKVAVGSKPCDACVCDVNGSASSTTVDALICLKKAVGQPVTLACPSCVVTTTTTVSADKPSTTSTSTTSTTTTIPVRCNDNGDCSGLQSGFRCNPNSDTCEKPCTRNADCHGIYDECNKSTGYCQEKLLLF